MEGSQRQGTGLARPGAPAPPVRHQIEANPGWNLTNKKGYRGRTWRTPGRAISRQPQKAKQRKQPKHPRILKGRMFRMFRITPPMFPMRPQMFRIALRRSLNGGPKNPTKSTSVSDVSDVSLLADRGGGLPKLRARLHPMFPMRPQMFPMFPITSSTAVVRSAPTAAVPAATRSSVSGGQRPAASGMRRPLLAPPGPGPRPRAARPLIRAPRSCRPLPRPRSE